MATTPQILRPSGSTQAPVAPWALSAGTTALAMDQVLDDEPAADATYLAHDSSLTTTAQRIEFGTFAVPAGAQVRSVQFRYRVTFPNYVSGDNRTYQVAQHGATGTRNAADTIYETIVAGTAVVPYNGAVWTSNPLGASWTQADIDALALSFAFFGGTQGSTIFRITEIYADVAYNEAPVVTITTPAEGGTVASTRPTFTWTYFDPEADQQERYQIKVFRDDTYLAGGFSPETSVADWDSTVVFSNATSVAMPTDLINGEIYKVYIRTSDQGSGGRWSDWTLAAANNIFTVTVTTAVTPTLTVTPQPNDARVELTILANDELGTHIIVEYSDDGGDTWEVHRAGNLAPVDPPTNLLTIYDHELPAGLPRQYRAKATTSDGSKTSLPSTPQTATINFTMWWLKDPLNPSLNKAVYLEGEDITIDMPEDIAVFAPLGRARKVVLSGDIRGDEFEAMFVMFSKVDRDAILALRDMQHTLLLQSPVGEQWYVRPISWNLVRHSFSPNIWRISAGFVEVDAPGEILLPTDIFTLDVSLLG